jgi:phenylacetaldehyde dehydrogenase
MTMIKIDKRVHDFVSTSRQMFIDGRLVDAKSNRTFETINPATGETLATVAEGDAADIDVAVKAARRAFDTGPWATMSPSDRGRIIWRIGDLIGEHLEEFAQLETLDNGKPLSVARAADVPLAAEMFRYMAGWATKIEGNTIGLSVPFAPGTEFHAYTLREPLGVVGQIIPWNFPILMAAWKLGPALATGNTVVLKPAEQTPLAALYLAEIMAQAGLPDGVVNVVTGYGETAGAALAAHPDVDKIAFTGSTAVGRLIATAATGNLKKVSLELGGKSADIVFADADHPAAITGAAGAVFFNQGECCVAGTRLYVQDSCYDELVAGVAEIAKSITVGDGLDLDTQMGPLVSAEQLATVTGYIESGRADGAEILSGGARRGERGYYVEPTVISNTRPDMRVVEEEIFGPVLVAAPFHDLDDVVAMANNTPYGLGAGIWTDNLTTAHSLAKRLRAGTIYVNCYNIFDAALPFGGYKQSGWGREMGHEALESYTEVKAVCAQL